MKVKIKATINPFDFAGPYYQYDSWIIQQLKKAGIPVRETLRFLGSGPDVKYGEIWAYKNFRFNKLVVVWIGEKEW